MGHSRSFSTYYIGTGETGSLYTLCLYSENHIPGREPQISDTYWCNLDTADLAAAKAKALAKLAEMGRDYSDIEVKAYASGRDWSKPSTEYMNFGKHNGRHMTDIPVDYLVWASDKPELRRKMGVRRTDFIRSLPNYKEYYETLKAVEAAREKAREEAAARREAEAALSNWVGEPGERLELEVDVLFTKWIETMYGSSKLVIFKAGDDKLKTFGTGADVRDMEKGDHLIIKGTVKKHEEYNGEKATMINRVALVEDLTPELEEAAA